MTSIIVTRNYQVTLPREIRKKTDIAIGETMLIETDGNEIVLKKMNEDPVKAAFGLWRGRIKESSVEYVRNLRKGWNRQHD